MCLNGVTEAYVISTSPSSSNGNSECVEERAHVNGKSGTPVPTNPPRYFISQLNLGLVLSSLVFVATIRPCMLYMGTSGLVWANAFSMVTRLVFNLRYIHNCTARPAATLNMPLLQSALEVVVQGTRRGRVGTGGLRGDSVDEDDVATGEDEAEETSTWTWTGAGTEDSVRQNGETEVENQVARDQTEDGDEHPDVLVSVAEMEGVEETEPVPGSSPAVRRRGRVRSGEGEDCGSQVSLDPVSSSSSPAYVVPSGPAAASLTRVVPHRRVWLALSLGLLLTFSTSSLFANQLDAHLTARTQSCSERTLYPPAQPHPRSALEQQTLREAECSDRVEWGSPLAATALVHLCAGVFSFCVYLLTAWRTHGSDLVPLVTMVRGGKER
eukprot:gene107-106_t